MTVIIFFLWWKLLSKSRYFYVKLNLFNMIVIWWKYFLRSWPFVRGNSPVTFNVLFDLHLNKRLSKQSKRSWFDAPLRSWWHRCNAKCETLRIEMIPQNCCKSASDTITMLSCETLWDQHYLKQAYCLWALKHFLGFWLYIVGIIFMDTEVFLCVMYIYTRN